MWWYPFCVGLSSVPLTHSHLRFSFFFLFFFMNGNTERAQCALSLVCIPQEMGKKGSKKNKKVYKIFKKCNKKIMPSGP